ncbi:MAG: putative hypothetical protein [Podoviridae sp. ctbj_2]|nr:MAG: putative hypothetical protein [Podoviridae sp. ctbj_2]
MKKSWTLGLSPIKRDEIIQEYHGSATVRRRLVEMLKEKKDAAQEKSLKENAYGSPNWGFLQADSVGYQRAITEIIDLIEDSVTKD